MCKAAVRCCKLGAFVAAAAAVTAAADNCVCTGGISAAAGSCCDFLRNNSARLRSRILGWSFLESFARYASFDLKGAKL